jgi:hypothetical protein
MTKEIAKAENEQGLGSLIGQLVEYAFNEVAKRPGCDKRTSHGKHTCLDSEAEFSDR